MVVEQCKQVPIGRLALPELATDPIGIGFEMLHTVVAQHVVEAAFKTFRLAQVAVSPVIVAPHIGSPNHRYARMRRKKSVHQTCATSIRTDHKNWFAIHVVLSSLDKIKCRDRFRSRSYRAIWSLACFLEPKYSSTRCLAASLITLACSG